jgi:hypothetical protein
MHAYMSERVMIESMRITTNVGGGGALSLRIQEVSVKEILL